jgi:hypothetical protein
MPTSEDGKVCLLIGVRSLQPLSSCKNLPPSTLHALGMLKFMIVFAWRFMMGKVHGGQNVGLNLIIFSS